MTNSSDLFFFYFFAVCAILFSYSAWVNLVQKRISRHGADAFLFNLYRLYAREKVEKLQLRENPAFIGRMGRLTIILGFSFLNATIVQLKIVWPYLHG